MAEPMRTHPDSVGIAATLHTIRHWFGTEFYRASGHDLRATQEAMGHESPVSTAIYAWTDPVRDADVVRALPSLDGGGTNVCS